MQLQDIQALAGLLLLVAAIIGSWAEMRLKVKRQEAELQALKRKFDGEWSSMRSQYVECRREQDGRFHQLMKEIADSNGKLFKAVAELKTQLAIQTQKLDDLINWKNNGGSDGNS